MPVTACARGIGTTYVSLLFCRCLILYHILDFCSLWVHPESGIRIETFMCCSIRLELHRSFDQSGKIFIICYYALPRFVCFKNCQKPVLCNQSQLFYLLCKNKLHTLYSQKYLPECPPTYLRKFFAKLANISSARVYGHLVCLSSASSLRLDSLD